MNNWEAYEYEIQRLVDIGKLKWDSKKGKWNKRFYPVSDDNNNFIKIKFGNMPRKTCRYCNKLLETVTENPNKRASKYCKIQHQKLHANIMLRAKRKFNLPEFDIKTFDIKTWKDWGVLFPPMYEYFYDKEGNLCERQLRDRIESKDIEVVINGKRFPYTTKSRTI